MNFDKVEGLPRTTVENNTYSNSWLLNILQKKYP